MKPFRESWKNRWYLVQQYQYSPGDRVYSRSTRFLVQLPQIMVWLRNRSKWRVGPHKQYVARFQINTDVSKVIQR